MRLSLLRASYEEWKRIRTTITPTFSAFKMKQVNHRITVNVRLAVMGAWGSKEHVPVIRTLVLVYVTQVVPLMQDSCETLVRKIGEIADSRQSAEMRRSASTCFAF